MTDATRSIRLPSWFITCVGASVAFAVTLFPPWGVIGWVKSVDDRLARIEERGVAAQRLTEALIKNHDERIERNASSIERIEDRLGVLERTPPGAPNERKR